MNYEFLNSEAFPDDPYVRHVVQVQIGGVIHPYCKFVMKDGGMFWAFPGVGAMKNGVKKRINADIDSKSAKIKFDNAVENYIDLKSGQQSVAMSASLQVEQPRSMSEVAENGDLPF